MGQVEKTVFVSYRRANIPWALAISQNLSQHGYDVFIDFLGLGSGAFEGIIVDQIRARAHFLVLLTPSTLERCVVQNDLMRREIEEAMLAKRGHAAPA